MTRGEIINFEEGRQKRLFSKTLNNWHGNAHSTISEYSDLVINDPISAIDSFDLFMDKVRDSAGPGSKGYEGMSGGANPDWTAPLIDVVGQIYQYLPKDSREKALRKVMSFLNGQNYINAQSNVEEIDEPWLCSDILINVNLLYWPGYKEYIDLIEKNPNWASLQEKLSDIQSSFWMSYAISRPNFTSEEIRRKFELAYPSLTDRTQDAIASFIAINAENKFLKSEIPIDETIQANLFKEYHTWIPKIKQKISERKWVDLDEPYYIGKPEEGETNREFYLFRSRIPFLLNSYLNDEDSAFLHDLHKTSEINPDIQKMLRFAILGKNERISEKDEFFILSNRENRYFICAGAKSVKEAKEIMELKIKEEENYSGKRWGNNDPILTFSIFSKSGVLIPV